jgi:GUN4-like
LLDFIARGWEALMMINFSLNEKAPDLEPEFTFPDLQDLLRAQAWKEADLETGRILMESKAPVRLQILDQIWRKSSDQRFGFGIQQKIYFECGGKPEDLVNIQSKGFDQDWYHGPWIKFAKTLGWTSNAHADWIDYNNLTFDISAPYGHLPCFGGAFIDYMERNENTVCGGPGRFYPMALEGFLVGCRA